MRFIGICWVFIVNSRFECRFIVLLFGFRSMDRFSGEWGVYLVVSFISLVSWLLVRLLVFVLVNVWFVVVLVYWIVLCRFRVIIMLVIVFSVICVCCLDLCSCCLFWCCVVMFWICDMKCSGLLLLVCISDIDSCF